MAVRVAGSGQVGQVTAVAESVLRNPLFVVGAVLLVLLVAGATYAVLRRWRRTTAERFVDALTGHDAVTVLMHPNPDPDAMASALAVGRLAADHDVDAALQYPGQIRHEENRVFENVLELDIERIDNRGDLESENVVLVDHNEARGFAGAGGLHPIAVVDHHPGSGTGSEFTDVRPGYGACATILSEYLAELGYTVEGRGGIDSATATGLFYGIYADTNHLMRGAVPEDFRAGAYLRPGVDDDLLDRIANPEVDGNILDVKARAILERRTEGPYVVSDVGTVENVDAISQAANDLLQLEGTSAVVVFGDHDGTLHLSGRSRDDRVHMGRALRAVVEDLPMAEAGGHRRMGGGQCSLDHLEGIGPGSGLSRTELREELFDAMASV